MIERGDWQVSDIARNAFDLENKVVGTIGAGRIGYRVLQRLVISISSVLKRVSDTGFKFQVPFDCKELLYYDYIPLPQGIFIFSFLALILMSRPSRGRRD
jgi:formate dehydrogenase